jgi:L-lactate dehydrogenase complex protein LldE
MRVSLLITCVVDVFEPQVGEATVRVLRAAGCDVSCNLDQTCCGQPAWNAGFAADAAKVARNTLAALEAELDDGAEAVVVPAGSCATMIRVFWPELFTVVGDEDGAARARAVGARTRELSEFLDERDLPRSSEGSAPVAYHHSCHMLRELGVREAPLALLAEAGCPVVAWSADDRCCGFGGLFSFKLPEVSVAMADDKLSSLLDTGADVVVGSDSSCLLHLRGRAESEGHPLVTRHLAEVLADHLEP